MQKLLLRVLVVWGAVAPLAAQTTSLPNAFKAPVKQVGLILEGASVNVADPLPDPEAKGAAEIQGNPGPGIKQEIIHVLEESKVSLSDQAKFELRTLFAVVDNPDDKNSPQQERLLAVSIKMVLIAKDTEKAEGEIAFKAKLAHGSRVRDIFKVAGGSGTIDPENKGARADHIELRKALGKPPVVEGTIAHATPDSPYGMEILVGGQARTLTLGQKEAFVELNRGDEYDVRVINTSGEEIAVALTIDGVNVFEFSDKEFRDPKTDRPLYQNYIVGKSDVIEGWFRKLSPPENYDAFLVTEYGKGAASKLGKPQGIGTIHLAISKCHPPGKGDRADVETGFGRKKSVKVEAVQRDIDPPHEFITVRYVR